MNSTISTVASAINYGEVDPLICKRGGETVGFILPFTDTEWEMNEFLRGTIYAFILFYFFLGVSIVADVFMGAIEVITSRRRQVMLQSGRVITVRIWNDTVANLTLMALGSSAPEILLAVTDLFKKEMYSGPLGPATIVGSASFNLLIIIGLCIFVIPSTEIRKVSEVPVFIVTVIFMFGAYIWMWLMVSVISPEVVDIWEAVVTLLALPVLVWISYLADIGRLMGNFGKSVEVKAEDVDRVCELLASFDRDTKDAVKLGLADNPHFVKKLESPSSADMDDFRKMLRKHVTIKKSRAARRVEATRTLTGGKRVLWDLAPTFALAPRTSGLQELTIADVPMALAKGTGPASVQFAVEMQQMSETLESKTITLVRSGDVSERIVVMYDVCTLDPPSGPKLQKSVSGESLGNSYSVSSIGALPGRKSITVSQTGDVTIEPDEDRTFLVIKKPSDCRKTFIVQIRSVTGQEGAPTNVSMGRIDRTAIMVKPEASDWTSRLGFPHERLCLQGNDETQLLPIMVHRLDGCVGDISVAYRTERLTAVPGYDFTDMEGRLEFPEGVTEQFIDLEILPKSSAATDDFMLVLEDLEGDAEFNPNNDGGLESEILTVEITPFGTVSMALGDKILAWVDKKLNFDELRLGTSAWSEQFVNGMYCNGSPEEQKEASLFDMIFHIVALPWKFVFMFVPPTTYFGGWLCFYLCLVFIAILTAVIGDVAEIFGCILGCTPLITAITFVALGTSMPDLFASKTAATQDPTADASIVNVTGSNSVNVFLGLGLPWTIGSVYWRVSPMDSLLGREWEAKYPEQAAEARKNGGVMMFVVPSGDLGFSVAVFTSVAILALVILYARRRRIGAELGGPFALKLVSALALLTLWCCYIALSSWWSLRQDHAEAGEIVAVICSVAAVGLVPCFASLVIAAFTKELPDIEPPKKTSKRGSVDVSERRSAEEEKKRLSITATKEPKLDSIKESAKESADGSANSAASATNGVSIVVDTKSALDRENSPPPPAEEERHAAEVRVTETHASEWAVRR